MHASDKSIVEAHIDLGLLVQVIDSNFNQLSGIFSVYLSLLQWDIKIPQTFKFVTAAFNFIIVALFLKFTISTMCHYIIMKQEVSEKPIIRVHTSIFPFR
jgi:hypothetical protein